ncbi:hypothetical protein L1286_05990 [Pseudoalteromonas sp. SMS1]|uniref:antiviral RADAR system adenosine deaminase RdrB n=1 Tax=Pseudoalteromonas sp. SMS1 TaxID=2908894 RepID=UPI001F1CE3A2|nr:antiviral RADAR system adenosine deaminase RdrB [Pseudoalteromonas sp. SMS1]MCF2857009.1 hypothetical protein [Pseudoalteromonas sp. SMS1]
MIILNDSQLSDIAFLTSDKAIASLGTQDPLGKNFLTRMAQMVGDYQPYIQRNLRNEDILNQLIAFNYDDPATSISTVLSRLSNTFLEWQGCRFEVKPQKLEQWLELLSLVDGSWIIAQGYVDLANDYNFSADDILTCIQTHQCPYALNGQEHVHQYADNHVHLGGHGHTGPSLLSFALYGEQLTDGWPTRPEFTYFESGRYEKAQLPKWCHSISNQLLACVFEHGEDRPLDLAAIKQNAKPVFAINGSSQGDQNLSQKALIRAHQPFIRSDKRWLAYCLGALYNFERAPKVTSQLIRLSNILRNYMIVWGTGLGQFVESFDFDGRKKFSRQHQDYPIDDSLTSDINQHVYREFRIAPNLLLSKQGEIKADIFEYALGSALKKSLAENLHFVVHFSRSSKRGELKREDRYQSELRKSLRKMVATLQSIKSSVSFSDEEISEFSKSKLVEEKAHIDLRKAIRGYDVAGNENELPIEVFAPALRVIRSAKHPSNTMFSSRFQRPFLTVHSGEDYSHLLSGLRAIDETVVFCDFKAGDRLGHALALGVFPAQWAQRQRTAYVTLGDHLDNLVWCYQKAIEVIQTVPKFTGVLQLLSEKIDFWANQLYPNQSYSVRELYESWKLRRNCPETMRVQPNQLGMPSSSHCNSGNQDWAIDFVMSEHVASYSTRVMDLWRQYLFAGTVHDGFSEISKRPVIVDCLPQLGEMPLRIENGRFYDSVSAAELELYEAIQDLQMESYSAQDIIIEACPTSNIYVGRFEQYNQHPIFRWDPPDPAWLQTGQEHNKFGLRRGAVQVCINTDDSALMPTTIANEHRVLQKVAVKHYGVGSTTSAQWIERIRNKGLEVFKSNHLNWVNES